MKNNNNYLISIAVLTTVILQLYACKTKDLIPQKNSDADVIYQNTLMEEDKNIEYSLTDNSDVSNVLLTETKETDNLNHDQEGSGLNYSLYKEQEKYEKDIISDIALGILPILRSFVINEYNGDGYKDIVRFWTDSKKQKKVLPDEKYLELAMYNISVLCVQKESIEKIRVKDNDYHKLHPLTKTAILMSNMCSSSLSTYTVNTQAFKDNVDLYILLANANFSINKNNMTENSKKFDDSSYYINLLDKKVIPLIKAGEIYSEEDPYENLLSIFQEARNNLDKLRKMIWDYSWNYEQQEYTDWCKKNNKKFLVGLLEESVYHKWFQPPKNGWLYSYNFNKSYPLRVFQTVSNGIILSGGSESDSEQLIYLQTSKQYADGQFIQEPIIAEFKGFYDYVTVKGFSKRIYKFYRYGQSEIDRFNKNQKYPKTLYFYNAKL